MSVARACEGKGLGDNGRQTAGPQICEQRFCDPVHAAFPPPPAQKVETEDTTILIQQPSRIPPGHGRGRHPKQAGQRGAQVATVFVERLRQAVHDESAARPEDPVILAERSWPIGVHHDVDTLTIGEPANFGLEVLAAGVDRMVHPLSLDGAVFGRRSGTEDLRTGVARDLSRRGPDATGGRMDKYPALGAQAAHDDQRGVRRGVAHAERRAFLEAQIVWHRQDISGLSGGQLGLTPEVGPGHHPLPNDKPADIRADRVDLAGHLIAQDAWCLWCGGVETHPRHGVGEVEARGPHCDPDLTRRHWRVEPFLDLENLRTAGPGQHDRLHGPKATPGDRSLMPDLRATGRQRRSRMDRRRLRRSGSMSDVPRRILMDVDTGTDDALAILYATRHPDLEVIGISCVAGNVPIDQVVINTCKVLDAAGAGDIPVAAGALQPLIERARRAGGSHGVNGLGGIQLPETSRRRSPLHAVELLHQLIMASTELVTLVTLAPKTNAAMLLSMYPEVATRLEQIIFMGGSASGGNVTALAEFNVWHDPEAAQCVIESSSLITMYSLDAFSRLSVRRTDADRFRDGDHPAIRLAGELLYRRRARSEEVNRDYVGLLGDAGAMVLLTNPELFVTHTFPVRVNLDGMGRGQTIVDQRAAPGEPAGHDPDPWSRIGVVVDLDVAQAATTFVNAIEAYDS